MQVVTQECLGHMVVLGKAHLRYILPQYMARHEVERPHQGCGNVSLGDAPPLGGPGVVLLSDVRCQERRGGLLQHSTPWVA